MLILLLKILGCLIVIGAIIFVALLMIGALVELCRQMKRKC